MIVSEEKLRMIVQRVLRELEQEEKRRKIYLVCLSEPDERYGACLKSLSISGKIALCVAVPDIWMENGSAKVLEDQGFPIEIRGYSAGIPSDLEDAVTVFPVVARDLVAKTALCISDTFESSWVSSCITGGGRVIFLGSGLEPFTGREPEPYVSQILSYYRTVLEYGVEIRSRKEGKPRVSREYGRKDSKKRVITAADVETYASEHVLWMEAGDIITDLARDRAGYLNIVIKNRVR